jgi:hypothetical protein
MRYELSRLKSGTMLLADRGYDADLIRTLAFKRDALANIGQLPCMRAACVD